MRSKTFLKIAILVILIAAAFRVGTAYAATGCFTIPTVTPTKSPSAG